MNKPAVVQLQKIFDRYGAALGTLAAFLIPIKLSWALAAIVPALLIYLGARGRSLPDLFMNPALIHLRVFAIFVVWILFSSFFGINPLHSWDGISSLAFFSLTAFMYFDLARAHGSLRFLIAMLCGQAVSSLHSILHSAYPWILPRFFIGMVTESGQLSISVVLALGLICIFNYRMLNTGGRPAAGLLIFGDLLTPTKRKIAFLFFVVSGAMLAFSRYFTPSNGAQLTLLMLFFAALALNAAGVYRLFRNSGPSNYFWVVLVSNIILPLCLCGLLANLKRGPWVGVTIGSFLLLLLFSRRMLAPVMLLVILLFCSVEPVRDRLSLSAEHFFIHGGRKVIWDIGAELATRFPLGIGYENSPVLRDFSTEIPVQLSHFHNNLINVLVETGWIGLSIFIWWLLAFLRAAWHAGVSQEDRILARTIACAFISLQVAGVVEYNFGDSEISFMVYMLLGVIGVLGLKQSAGAALEPNLNGRHAASGQFPVESRPGIR